MSWQGIPFKLVDGQRIEQINLAMHSIPKITIDNPTDYYQLALTVGASLFGGIIPAIIAWRTFKANSRNLQKEREEQHRFLRAERAKNHIYLMSERASQIKNMEDDRKTQLEISRRNFNMQVLSINRQNWINELRNLASEFCVKCHEFLEVTYIALRDEKQYDLFINEFPIENSRTPEQTDKFNKYDVVMEKSASIANSVKREIDVVHNKIILMLNPSELVSKKILSLMDSMVLTISTLSLETQKNISGVNEDFGNYRQVESNLMNNTVELLSEIKKCLKTEWIRVKNGE